MYKLVLIIIYFELGINIYIYIYIKLGNYISLKKELISNLHSIIGLLRMRAKNSYFTLW